LESSAEIPDVVIDDRKRNRLLLIEAATDAVEDSILRWTASGAWKRANLQPFLTERCRLLDVKAPAAQRNTRGIFI